MLTEAQVQRRATLYGCCSNNYLGIFVDNDIHGAVECAQKNYRIGMYMLWAEDIMCSTQTEDNPDGCHSIEYASQVAQKADCYCKDCGCPDTCVVTPNYTVIATVSVSQRAAIEGIPPQVGDQWFVVTGTTDGIWSINNVVRWNGSGWDLIPLLSGRIVMTSAGVFWSSNGQTPGLLYPTVTAEFQSPGVYTIVSNYPSIASISDRTVIIQAFGEITPDVYGWTTILTVSEQAIATPYEFNFTGITLDAVRAIYVDGECQYVSDVGDIEPPGCVMPGAHECTSHEITSHF